MLSATVRRFVFASFVFVCTLSAFAFFSQQVLLKKQEAIVAPTLNATKSAATLTDVNGNGVINPGDSLRYTVQINNTGVNPATDTATDLNLSDTIDANTTLIGGSVIASAVAVNDAYASIGNVGISVPDGPNDLLANDLNPNGSGTFTITIAPTVSAQAGQVSINTTTGAFTYNPPAGFEGTDTFVYTLSNGTTLTDTATVTITVSGMIWFIDNSQATNGNGRLGSPFNSIANFNAGAADDPGDTIFLYRQTATDYVGPLTLLNNQKLVGQGASATLASIAVITVPTFSNALPATGGTNPNITSATVGITLGQGNTIRGLSIGNGGTAAGNAKIFGNNFGTLTLGNSTAPDVFLSGTGQALNLTTGTFAATSALSSLTTTSSISQGILLSGVAGTIAFGSTTVSGNPTQCVLVTGSTASVNFGNTSCTGGTDLISLQNNSSGTRTFGTITTTGGSGVGFLHSVGGGLTNITGLATFTNPGGRCIDIQNAAASNGVTFANVNATQCGGTGVSLNANTEAVTFADLDIAPDSGQRGFHSTNNTGTITTTSGIISTTNQTAVEIVGVSAASRTPLNITLTSVSALASGGNPPNGIILTNINGPGAAVGFVVNGDGTNTSVGGNGSGGTISNTSGVDDDSPADAGGIGVRLVNADEVVLRRITLTTQSNFGIYGENSSNFTFEYSKVNGTNGTAAGINNTNNSDASVVFNELTGAALFKDSLIEGALEDNVRIINTVAGSILNRLVFNNVTIGLMDLGNSLGDNAMLLQARNNATMNVTIQDSDFTHARGDIFQFDLTNTATGDLIFDNNTVNNQHPNIVTGGGGITISGGGSAAAAPNLTYEFDNNTFRGARGSLLLIIWQTGSGSANGRIEGNTFGANGVDKSGSSEANNIEIRTEGRGAQTVLINNNTIRQYSAFGIYMEFDGINTGGSTGTIGALNATITNNLIEQPSTAVVTHKNGIHLNHGATAGDTYSSCVDIKTNTTGNAGSETSIGQDIILRQRILTTVRLPGYVGAFDDDVAVENFIANQNTGAESVNALSDAPSSGGGFVGGGACTQAVAFAPLFVPLVEENTAKMIDINNNNLSLLNLSYQSSSEMLNGIQPLFNHSANADAPLSGEIVSTEKAVEDVPVTSNTNYWATFGTVLSNASSALDEMTGKLGSAILPTAHAQKDSKDAMLSPESGETVTKALGTLPPGENIRVQFDVTVDANIPTNDFSVSNTAQITSTNHATINSTTATTTVVHPPTISKAFGANNIAVGGTTTLTFTIGNANSSTATNVAFTDNLPAGIVVASPNGLVNNCGGGTVSAVAGASSISVSALSRNAATNCTIVVNVTGTTDGLKNNTTTAIASTEGGTGLTSNTAVLNVIAAPSFTKAFGASSIPLNTSTSLSFTITNNSSSSALNGVSFTDNLPVGLVVSTPPNQTGSCGGTITANAGANSVSLSGATLAASANCTFSVNVTGTSAGTKNNSTTLSTTELGTGATANASITIVAPPTITKSFSPTSILVGETSTLTISITNPSENVVALTGVGVTDNFPSGLVVDSAPSPTNSCATGTFNPAAGATSISISGATIPGNTTCSFSVKVKATTAGAKNNTTGNVTSTNGGTGATASATLTVTSNSYEADLAPRPDGSGDGFVNVGDITQVRRFVAGLDQPYQSNEFQRVDSAPFNSLGDGFVNAGDVTQVRRYAAGLDSVQTAGGPTAPPASPNPLNGLSEQTKDKADFEDGEDDDNQGAESKDNVSDSTAAVIAAPRELRPSRVSLTGNVLTVAVNLNTDAADTPANAVGFSLLFDTMVLSNPTNIRLGANAPAATTISENTTQAAMGRVGIVLDLPVSPAQTFPTGDAQLVLIDFTVIAMPPATTTLSFGDTPVQQFVGDINGNSLPTTFSSGNISLLQPTAAAVTISGRVATSTGRGISKARITLTDQNGDVRYAMTNPFGYYRFADVSAGEVVVLSVKAKRYEFAQPTIVLQVNEDLSEMNFIAMPASKFNLNGGYYK